MGWPKDMLEAIVEADDPEVSPLREDGRTYGTPTWIWCVEVDGALYVRPWNGARSGRYRAAMARSAGCIIAAGRVRDVLFSPADDGLAGVIDDAHRRKYAGMEYLPDMISAGPRAAGVRIDPRG